MAKLNEHKADISPMGKTCAKCSRWTPLSGFYKSQKSGADGLHSYCKPCERQRRRDRNFDLNVEKYGLEEATQRAKLLAKKRSVAEGNRLCHSCLKEKPLADFNSHPNTKSKKHYDCKLCVSEIQKAYRKQSPRHRLAVTFNTAKQTARRKGLPIDISIEYLIWLWGWQRGLCYYTGTEMLFDGGGRPESVSIDRISSSEGYVMGNVALCCTYVNTMKNDRPCSEFLEWCRRVVTSSMKSGV